MAGSTNYDVVLRLRTEGELGTKLAAIGGHAQTADRHIVHLGESIARMGERAGGFLESIADKAAEAGMHLAKLGAAAVIGAAAYGVAHLNRELEETKITLAAISQAQGFTKTFEQGFTLAGDQLRKMKQDVKTLPGDLGQLSAIMTMIATPAAQGGASMDKIRELSGRTMLTAAILNVPQEVASREMAALLSGRAGSHNILGSRLGFLGEEAKKFNAESPEKRLEDVGKALDKYQGAADRFGRSFTAQFTTLKDNIKYGFLAPATEGLFERVKNSMAEINTYFDEHKQKVEEIAGTISRRLVAGWDEIENIVKRVGPYIGKYADMIVHMQPAEIAKKLEHAGELLIGTKLAGGALSAGSSMIPTALRLLGGAGGTGELGAGITALGEALPAIGAAALVAAPVVVGVAGAFDILTDKTSIYHDSAVQLSKEIGTGLTDALHKVSDGTEGARDALHKFGDFMGNDLLVDANYGVKALNWVLDAIKDIGDATGLSHYGLTDDEEKHMERFRNSVDIGDKPDHDVAAAWSALMLAPNEKFGQKEEAAGKHDKAPAGHGGTHIQKVEIVIPGNTDPSRVARLTVREIKRIGRNPTRSPGVMDFESP